jgi:hypothetical protein
MQNEVGARLLRGEALAPCGLGERLFEIGVDGVHVAGEPVFCGDFSFDPVEGVGAQLIRPG